jgi:hypothetical protein
MNHAFATAPVAQMIAHPPEVNMPVGLFSRHENGRSRRPSIATSSVPGLGRDAQAWMVGAVSCATAIALRRAARGIFSPGLPTVSDPLMPDFARPGVFRN